jgi:hypothetical protein
MPVAPKQTCTTLPDNFPYLTPKFYHTFISCPRLVCHTRTAAEAEMVADRRRCGMAAEAAKVTSHPRVLTAVP